MQTSRFSRVMSLCLAAVITGVVLGGIDHLSQRDEAAPQWAQHTTPRA